MQDAIPFLRSSLFQRRLTILLDRILNDEWGLRLWEHRRKYYFIQWHCEKYGNRVMKGKTRMWGRISRATYVNNVGKSRGESNGFLYHLSIRDNHEIALFFLLPLPSSRLRWISFLCHWRISQKDPRSLGIRSEFSDIKIYYKRIS